MQNNNSNSKGRRYKHYESDQYQFYQIPKDLFLIDKYKVLSSDAKLLYGMLLDKMHLSRKNNWLNSQGDIYFIFSREKVRELLCISDKTCTKAFKELKEVELIEEVRQGLGKPNIIYINHIEYNEINYESVENTDFEQNRKIYDSRTVKPTIQESENLRPNNTNTNNTNLNNICSSSNEIDIYKEFELNICELRKTTRLKFDEVVNKHDSDFILSILEQCSISNIKSYAGFEKVYNSYLERNCTTRSDVEQATNDYRINNTKKNKKERGEPKKANKNGFNNFKHREMYNSEEQMKDLENKLLGWE